MARSSSGAHAHGTASDGARHRLDLIRGSIALLANGGASRVTLVGPGLPDRSLRDARALARSNGLLLRVSPRGAAWDITLEASG
jgi:hypothetical protein